MAIFHMTVKIHGRSKGQSAVSCAAYRSGSELYDEQIGRTYDYTRKKGVVYTEILLCRNAPEEYMDRERLWNSVMAVEKASNAQFAREFEIALPAECDREIQIRMLHDFFTPLVEEGMCIDLAIHDTGFFSNYPTQEVIDEIFSFLNEKKLVPVSGKVFDFENIREALTAQDEGNVNGKIVVKV